MRRCLGIALVASVLLTVGAEEGMAADCDAPNPDFQITKSTASTGPTAAAFGGVWSGVLTITSHRKGGNENLLLCIRLHVSVKDDQNASVAYCRGSLREIGRLPQCSVFNDAKIDGNKLSFSTWTLTGAGPDKLTAETISLDKTPIVADFRRQE